MIEFPPPTLGEEVNRLHAEVCAAMADPRRIMLLYALSGAPRNVTDLAEAVGIAQPAASRHLKLLRERGMVRAVRHGQSIEYALADVRLLQALDLLRAVLRDRINYRASLIATD